MKRHTLSAAHVRGDILREAVASGALDQGIGTTHCTLPVKRENWYVFDARCMVFRLACPWCNGMVYGKGKRRGALVSLMPHGGCGGLVRYVLLEGRE